MMGDGHLDDDLFGEELRAAVDRLAHAERPSAEARSRAESRMRDAYASHTPSESGRDALADAELVTLIAEQRRRAGAPRRAVVIAAAAVALVGVVALAWFVRVDDTPIPTDEPSEPLLPAPPPAPRALGTGTFTTDVLGLGMRLTADEPLWLLRAEPGVVEFGLGAPQDDPSTLTIVRPDRLSTELGVDTLEELFRSTAGSQEQPSVIDERSALSWRLLDPKATDLCSDDTCVPLFDEPAVTIRPDRVADVFELPIGTDEVGVLIATAHPDQFTFDPGGPFVDVIRSIEIDDTTPIVDPQGVPVVELVATVPPA